MKGLEGFFDLLFLLLNLILDPVGFLISVGIIAAVGAAAWLFERS